MKRNVCLTLFVWMLLFAMMLPMVACGKVGGEDVADASTEAETEPRVPALDPAGFGKADDEYVCRDESVLYTYKNKTAEQFAGVCTFYEESGYTLYNESEKAGNLFATYVRDTDMAHVYRIAHSSELCIVLSESAGEALPPASSPEIMQGDFTPSITQLRDGSNVNGMCYIVQLPDGSFIVYDGSYSPRGKKVLAQLRELHGEQGTPLIRAWVLTHSHDDHYPAFSYICNKNASDVKVEYVIFAPIESALAKQIGGDDYFNNGIHADVAKLGAKLVYAHTGMEFAFGDFRMEVLLAADDLFKVGNHNNYFNNSSLVTRIYTQDYSALFTGDTGKEGAVWMMDTYSEYLQSNVCQVSHHGVEDVPLEFYETVQASILYYPCNQWLYDQKERHYDVRMALEQRSYTKEILIAGVGLFTRAWGTTFEQDAPLSMPEYKRK